MVGCIGLAIDALHLTAGMNIWFCEVVLQVFTLHWDPIAYCYHGCGVCQWYIRIKALDVVRNVIIQRMGIIWRNDAAPFLSRLRDSRNCGHGGTLVLSWQAWL